MNAEESLSLTLSQIRQIGQKTLENLLPEKSKPQYENKTFSSLLFIIQGVFEVEAFLLTCGSMRCSKKF
jgi:hypothetical protein